MHLIPFPNDSFDAIVCGKTLSYSAKPPKALREVLKCVKLRYHCNKNRRRKKARIRNKIKKQNNRLVNSRVTKAA